MIEEDIYALERKCEKLQHILRSLCEKLGISCPYEDHDYDYENDEWSVEHETFVSRCSWCGFVKIPPKPARPHPSKSLRKNR